jgi:outer membrane protein insertion porin family/translocation and assembly module TamA
VRYASKLTGSSPAIQFARLTADGSVYRPLGADIVLAMRVRMGGVLGPTLALDRNASFVPAQERLFAGGPNTVRGFQQNELGPAVYIPSRYDTISVATGLPVSGALAVGDQVWFRSADTVSQRAVPTGGNAMVVGNVELRIVSPFLPELLKWTAFVDVGRVWNRGSGADRLKFATLAATPGIGVRIRTPIGYLRVDVAYNPYERPAGAAYFDAPLTEGGALYCVSPGNSLTVTKLVDPQNASRTILSQAAGTCPGTFGPPRGSSFFSRLRPSIAIGQAF